MSTQSIVIVGASLAGLSAAETLRQQGFDGRITIIGDEPYLPYDRPPLSKQILQGTWLPEQAVLRTPDHYEKIGLEFRLGKPATHLDVAQRRVVVGDEEFGYDSCLIAVGVRARSIPSIGAMRGIHLLRTLDDATRLRAALQSSSSLVVVGAGFIGLEVAASARQLGAEVTVVESLAAPLARTLGEEIGARIADLHRGHGVKVRCGVGVVGVDGGDQVEQVRLTDGSRIAADNVVVGVGTVPNVEWLRSSHIEVDDGVVCDEFCRTSAPGVYAAGDVARWRPALFGVRRRVEHWTNAVEQGRAAALNMLAAGAEGGTSYSHLPYFWSDQYDTKIQFSGHRCDNDSMYLQEDPTSGQLLALFGHSDKLVGVVTFNWPRQAAIYRGRILQGTSWADAVALARAAR